MSTFYVSKETILLLDYNFWLLYLLGINPLLLNFCTELVLTIVLHIFSNLYTIERAREGGESGPEANTAGMDMEGLHSK